MMYLLQGSVERCLSRYKCRICSKDAKLVVMTHRSLPATLPKREEVSQDGYRAGPVVYCSSRIACNIKHQQFVLVTAQPTVVWIGELQPGQDNGRDGNCQEGVAAMAGPRRACAAMQCDVYYVG